MTPNADISYPPPWFVGFSAAVLSLILFWLVLTVWLPDGWNVGFAEAAVLALGAAWGLRLTVRPYALRMSPILIPLSGAVIVGLMQLLSGHTANRWETWNAVLRWSVYLTAFFLASQIAASPNILAGFRRALVYFGFGLSAVAVLQYFTSPGKIFWLFDYEYSDAVLGPFLNHDHYAAFMELVLPMALFEAFTDRRRVLFAGAMAGTMVASVIASASRAGSALVILESAAVLLIASRSSRSARRLGGALTAALLACSLAFTAVVGWTHLWERFTDPGTYRGPGRREMLVSAIAMGRAKLWAGFGLGNFENAYPAFALFDDGSVVNHAHNDWAEWTAEGGLPFLACMLAIAVLGASRLARSLWGIGVLAMWLHCLIDFPMQRPALGLWVFVLLGAACSQPKTKPRLPNI
jgi:hypothetical protein